MNERYEDYPFRVEQQLAHPEVNTERFDAIADALDGASQLVIDLRNDREPDAVQYEVFFDASTLGGIYLPEQIRDTLLTRSLHSIEIKGLRTDVRPDAMQLSVAFFASDGLSNDQEDMTQTTLYMSLSAHDGQYAHGECINEAGSETHIGIPYPEMRQSLESMFQPGSYIDYHNPIVIDKLPETVPESIPSAVRKAASIANSVYAFYDDQHNEVGSIEFGTMDQELCTVELTKILTKKSGVSEDGTLTDAQRAIAAQISLEKGKMGIELYKREGPIGASGTSEEFIPDVHDIRILCEFIAEQSGSLTGTPIVSLNETHQQIIVEDEL
jgi:hypothetical protein